MCGNKKPLFHTQIYKKKIYALLVKSNKYINIYMPNNVCNFDSLISLRKMNFRLYIVYLGNHSV